MYMGWHMAFQLRQAPVHVKLDPDQLKVDKVHQRVRIQWIFHGSQKPFCR
jgi:hypothetical protein